MIADDDEDEKEMYCRDAIKSNGFSDRILALLRSKQKNKNLILSPLSIQIAMTLCMAGSAKGTLKEMMAVLYPNDDAKSKKKKTKEMLKLCDYYNREYGSGDKDKPVLKLANKVWIEKNYLKDGTVLDSYCLAVRETNVSSIDTSDPLQAAKLVNKWCAANTSNMIKKIVNARGMR